MSRLPATASETTDAAAPLIAFCGHAFEPLRSGALFWPAQRTLLVADLHLEKFSSFGRHGSLLPPYDTTETLRRLTLDVAQTGATHIVALGDSFHRDEGSRTLLEADRVALDALREQVRWTWISGNHDPLPHDMGTCVPETAIAGLTLAHHPARGRIGLVAGHLHPAARVMLNGVSVRRPCFVHDGRLMILPAYGAATGSMNILSAPFVGLLSWSRLEVTMIGRDRLYAVSPRRLVGGL